jgi:2-polyprenyl-3-methyl-5-hydroxy-6-metoxy-1,4-benzoquinol methylase
MAHAMIAAVADDALSRRNLFRLNFGARAPVRADPVDVKLAITRRWVAGGDALLRAWEPLAPAVCDVAGIGPGMRVLDAATGDGNVALEAAHRGATVTAADLVMRQLERAATRAIAAGLPIEWLAADVESLPVADETFDVVLSVYGAIFAPRPRRAARALLRALRPGGLLVLAAPAPGSLLARAFELAGHPTGIPSPAAWGREDVARERILAVAPDTDVEVRTHSLALGFESELGAWLAHAGPLGLAGAARDRFADAVAMLADDAASVRIDEPVTLVLARRAG